MRMLAALLLLGLCACNAAAPQAADEVSATPSDPLARPNRVTDVAGILSADEESEFAASLRDFERRTQHQMVVVTVPDLGGRAIAEFARDLGNRWGVGRRGVNDGILILVAPNERQVRIAIGDGLAPAFPDEAAAEIIDRLMLPRHRVGDHAGAIRAAIAAIAARLGGAGR